MEKIENRLNVKISTEIISKQKIMRNYTRTEWNKFTIEKNNTAEVIHLLNKIGMKSKRTDCRLKTSDVCTLVGRTLPNIVKLACTNGKDTTFATKIKNLNTLSVDQLLSKKDRRVEERENRARRIRELVNAE